MQLSDILFVHLTSDRGSMEAWGDFARDLVGKFSSDSRDGNLTITTVGGDAGFITRYDRKTVVSLGKAPQK